MKVVFMGTPDFAVAPLKALYKHHDVLCVYTQPPRPSGRGHKVTLSPVHKYAEEHQIPVFTPISLKKAEEQSLFKSLHADVAIVAAYGLILPQACLDAFKFGCINIHGSLLPRWRGAAPIQRAIMAGDKETGVTIMQMDAGMDTGDMLLKKHIPITSKTTAQSLHDEMAIVGAETLLKALTFLEEGILMPRKQPEEGVTIAPKIKKEDGIIDWNKTAKEIDCQIRALAVWPGTWFMHGEERISVIEAKPVEMPEQKPAGTICEDGVIACGEDGLKLTILKRDGKKALSLKEFLNGYDLSIGTVLNSDAAL